MLLSLSLLLLTLLCIASGPGLIHAYVGLKSSSSNNNIYHHAAVTIGVIKMERVKKVVLLTTLHAKKNSSISPKKGFGSIKKDLSSEASASEVTQKSSQVNRMVDDDGRPIPDGAAVVQVEDSNRRGVPMTDEDMILNTKMFKSDRLRREDILNEKIKRLQAEDDLIASDPSVGAVPELVADRMIRRIAVFFGVPVFGGLSIFVGAFFYSKKYDITLPPVIVAYATQLPFVVGLLGITYGILSSSWDNVSIAYYY